MSHGDVKNISIWVVEDDELYRNTICSYLNNIAPDNMRCSETFTSCEGALEQLQWERSPRPDVILLDINLPGLNGVDGVGLMKALAPEVRIIMLTIVDNAETIYGALRAGASGYLIKHAELGQIMATIEEASRGGTYMPPGVAEKVFDFFTRLGPAQDYNLTKREKEVLRDMSDGYAQKTIADRLGRSRHTVDKHIRHIYEKLHVNSNIEAVSKALRERIV